MKLSKSIKVGTVVTIVSGNFKGKSGKISSVLSKNGKKTKVVVSGLNTRKDIVNKISGDGKEFVSKDCPISISNIKIK